MALAIWAQAPVDKPSCLLDSNLSPGAWVRRRHPLWGQTKYQGQHTRRTPFVELLRLCSSDNRNAPITLINQIYSSSIALQEMKWSYLAVLIHSLVVGTPTPSMDCVDDSPLPIADDQGVNCVYHFAHPVIFFVLCRCRCQRENCPIGKADAAIKHRLPS
ncbi:hypothetical protein PGT21_015214 [Puccinia graminis f. sp. tritici]|uniref:Uncharacterized protein n=1 Tax=Puccinia graminis f. sp. tritici TaxID=56615 RepID=A0A5B0LN93_PUCGR|nr:hypothetical protein PGTUg99_019130 [Puccinia graminis f. sp. tritici]KAA1090839.1 hypothetical protein PGT21_015214 [Puccinia graminis f. sp. tritici]